MSQQNVSFSSDPSTGIFSDETAVIIGAGPAGLTAAYELLTLSLIHISSGKNMRWIPLSGWSPPAAAWAD